MDGMLIFWDMCTNPSKIWPTLGQQSMTTNPIEEVNGTPSWGFQIKSFLFNLISTQWCDKLMAIEWINHCFILHMLVCCMYHVLPSKCWIPSPNQCQDSTALVSNCSAASHPICAYFWAPCTPVTPEGRAVGDKLSITTICLDEICFASARVRLLRCSVDPRQSHSCCLLCSMLEGKGPMNRPGYAIGRRSRAS